MVPNITNIDTSNDRGPATQLIELKQIVGFLIKNGYEFQRTREARYILRNEAGDGFDKLWYQYDFIADFKKCIPFTDSEGDWYTDHEMIVSIHFASDTDYENMDVDENGYFIYLGDPTAFINKVIESVRPTPQ